MKLETRSLRHVADVLVSNVDKKSTNGERTVQLCNYTDVYYQARVTSDLAFMSATATPDQVARFGLLAGDSIITKDSETANDIAVAAYVPHDLPGVVCGYHLALIRPRPTAIDPSFLGWTFQSDFLREQFAARATGVTRYGLTYEAIQGVQIPLSAPVDEQRRIADFLDDRVARIDAATADRNKQLALCDARSVASVNQEFRRAASVVQVRRLLAAPAQYGLIPERPTSDREDWPRYIRTTDITADGSLKRETFQSVDPLDARGYELLPLDVLVSRAGSIGTCLVFDNLQPAAVFAGYLIRLRFRNYLPHLFQHFLLSTAFQAQVSQGAVQSTILNFSAEKYRGLLVPWFEPREQIAVTRVLTGLLDDQRALRQAIERSVQLLQERKRALITAAVTGEFDVSTAGPRASAAVTA